MSTESTSIGCFRQSPTNSALPDMPEQWIHRDVGATPRLSLLLGTTKGCYSARLLVSIHPDNPNFGEARWITSEDVNIEHLLDVSTLVDANTELGRCLGCLFQFTNHLCLRKPRLILLGPKIEVLPGDHPSKAESYECSHGCSTRSEIRWNGNSSPLATWNSGEVGGIALRLL